MARKGSNAQNVAQTLQEPISQDTPNPRQEQNPASAPTQDGEKVRKSIVPTKYAGKYAKGGSDALAEFINAECGGKDGFEWTAFFQLCRDNGVPEDQVTKYSNLVTSKAHGANGRARMTLRNMLKAIAGKQDLKRLNGETVHIDVPKQAVSGAAAKAQKDAVEKAANVVEEGVEGSA